uniref:Uncharacterized protein n=1 Tax=Arcella intermedia TaxID=1963864 RepID=A0A6B2LC98_9EUKA
MGRTKDLKGAHKGFIDGHHGAGVVELPAVVGGGEDGDELALGEELVAVLDDLVRTDHEVEFVPAQEVFYNVPTKRERDTTIVLLPSLNLRIRISPQQIAKQTRIRNLSRPNNPPNLLQSLQIRRKPTMNTKNLILNNRTKRQTIKTIIKQLPNLQTIARLALVVEPVDSINRRTFVVASKHEEVLGVLDFVCEEQADGLQAVWASVYVVAEEEVVGVWWEAAVLEEAEEVVVLAVDVADDFEGGFEVEEDWLADEDLSGFFDEVADFVDFELDLGAWSACSFL